MYNVLEHCLACDMRSLQYGPTISITIIPSPVPSWLQTHFLTLYSMKLLWERPPMADLFVNLMIIFQSATIILDLQSGPTPSLNSLFPHPTTEYYSCSTLNHVGRPSSFCSLKMGSARAWASLEPAASSVLPCPTLSRQCGLQLPRSSEWIPKLHLQPGSFLFLIISISSSARISNLSSLKPNSLYPS